MRSSVLGPISAAISSRIGLRFSLGDRVGNPGGQGLEVLDDVLAAGLAGLVVLDHLADALQNLAADALGGKLLEHLPDELVLAGVAPQLQLAQQPLGRELHDRAQRRRQLLLQIGLVGKRRQQVVQDLPGLLVTLALEIEPGDLLVVLDRSSD